jgi:hypothetical protein
VSLFWLKYRQFKVEKVFDFSKPPLNTTGCAPTGIALGPDHQLATSCGLIIDDQTGAIIANFASEGGADEIWFNPQRQSLLLGRYWRGPLGVIDAGPPAATDLTAPTAPGSHSVAADSVTNEVYVPIRGNQGVAPPLGAICSTAKDVFGNAGSDALGCILSYIAPTDSDDHPAKHARR